MYDRNERDITALVEARDRDGGAFSARNGSTGSASWGLAAWLAIRRLMVAAYIGRRGDWLDRRGGERKGKRCQWVGTAGWCTKNMTTQLAIHPERSERSNSGCQWVWLRAAVGAAVARRECASVAVTCLDQGRDVSLISVVHTFLACFRLCLAREVDFPDYLRIVRIVYGQGWGQRVDRSSVSAHVRSIASDAKGFQRFVLVNKLFQTLTSSMYTTGFEVREEPDELVYVRIETWCTGVGPGYHNSKRIAKSGSEIVANFRAPRELTTTLRT
ncbi:hypothetical protein B0H11DRAFT_1898449 [Mycena galericulata]|nr:hypothetical protein B0H11DRAFT_1898449 [Mycena galericulata]